MNHRSVGERGCPLYDSFVPAFDPESHRLNNVGVYSTAQLAWPNHPLGSHI